MKTFCYLVGLLCYSCHTLYKTPFLAKPQQLEKSVEVNFLNSGGTLGSARFQLPDSLFVYSDPTAYFCPAPSIRLSTRSADGQPVELSTSKLSSQHPHVVNLTAFTAEKVRIILSIGSQENWKEIQYAAVNLRPKLP